MKTHPAYDVLDRYFNTVVMGVPPAGQAPASQPGSAESTKAKGDLESAAAEAEAEAQIVESQNDSALARILLDMMTRRTGDQGMSR